MKNVGKVPFIGQYDHLPSPWFKLNRSFLDQMSKSDLVPLLNTLLLITPCELQTRRIALRLSLSFFSASGIKWTAWKMGNWNTFIFRENEQYVVEYQSFWKLSPVLNSVLYIIPGSEFGEHHFLHRLIWGYSDKSLYSIGYIPEPILHRLCYIGYVT